MVEVVALLLLGSVYSQKPNLIIGSSMGLPDHRVCVLGCRGHGPGSRTVCVGARTRGAARRTPTPPLRGGRAGSGQQGVAQGTGLWRPLVPMPPDGPWAPKGHAGFQLTRPPKSYRDPCSGPGVDPDPIIGKYENEIFGISASREFRQVNICHVFGSKKLTSFNAQKNFLVASAPEFIITDKWTCQLSPFPRPSRTHSFGVLC